MQGVDKEYDDAEGRVKDKEADLAEYLAQIRKQLGAGKNLGYVTVNKDVNLLEIPQVHFITCADGLPTLQNDLCLVHIAGSTDTQRFASAPTPSVQNSTHSV